MAVARETTIVLGDGRTTATPVTGEIQDATVPAPWRSNLEMLPTEISGE